MNKNIRRSRLLLIIGLVAMVAGAIDPLEGSVVILAGIGLVAFATNYIKSRQRKLLLWAFILVTLGVGTMWGLSSTGGFGGNRDLSYWWGILLLPYPIGWIIGLRGAILALRDTSIKTVSSDS